MALNDETSSRQAPDIIDTTGATGGTGAGGGPGSPTPDAPGLQAQLATMKGEIDALQIGLADATKPWFRQSSTLIALLALLFSFGTTFYSEQRTHRQDVHNAKVELRQLIQQLTELPQRNADLTTKYEKNPTALLNASSWINTQQIVLAKQAVDIIDEIPDEVSSTEYYAVASALAVSGAYDRTLDLYQRGLDKARDANDWTAASRSLAQAAFATGDLARGRASFQQALNVFDRFPVQNRYVVSYTHTFTELSWTQAELASRQCSEAEAHLAKADDYLAEMDTAADPRLSSQLNTVSAAVDKCVPPAAPG